MSLGGAGWNDRQRMDREERVRSEERLASRMANEWGIECPAPTRDFLFAEYFDARPVALVDYQYFAVDPATLDPRTHLILQDLRNQAGEQLPFFVARYWPECWAFKVWAVNPAARRHLDTADWVPMSEHDWVRGLYQIKKGELKPGDRKHIDRYCRRDKPPNEQPFSQVASLDRKRAARAISEEHYTWGRDCPGTDLDSLLCEYNHNVSIALIDYKMPHTHERLSSTNRKTFNVLSQLYDPQDKQLPFFVAKYWPDDDWAFKVLPYNAEAQRWIREFYRGRWHVDGWNPMHEQDYVRFLYSMRARALKLRDEWALSRLNQKLPPMDDAA